MGLDRDTLAALPERLTWTPLLGEDQYGNSTYGAPVVVNAFIAKLTRRLGAQDGQGKQEGIVVTEGNAMTDALGIAPRDRVTTRGGIVLYVHSADTATDETGADAYQDLILSTEQKG